MSARKKYLRALFRCAVFARADYRCEGPGCLFRSSRERSETELDAHHITNRNEMPHGGYVSTNGIALCASCHEKAEVYHATGTPYPGFAPAELYAVIGSSWELAQQHARREQG